MTSRDCVNRALSLLDWHYIYGFKYRDNPVKKSKIDTLRAQYSSVFTSAYYSKALTFVGKNAIDCSGLVCYAWNIADIGSWNIHDLPSKDNKYKLVNVNCDIPIGSALWKTGHCGIYIGDGKAIEARGIDYGVCITDLMLRAWEKAVIPSFESIQDDYKNLGWNKNENGWWYATGTKLGDYYKDCIATIDNKQYAFNINGYCIKNPICETDENYSILHVYGEE